jgi:hypothetical protein
MAARASGLHWPPDRNFCVNSLLMDVHTVGHLPLLPPLPAVPLPLLLLPLFPLPPSLRGNSLVKPEISGNEKAAAVETRRKMKVNRMLIVNWVHCSAEERLVGACWSERRAIWILLHNLKKKSKLRSRTPWVTTLFYIQVTCRSRRVHIHFRLVTWFPWSATRVNVGLALPILQATSRRTTRCEA